MRSIKLLIWLYVALLLTEGALRKWIFPPLADPLLVVRDPVLLLIYALSLRAGIFPLNRWTAALAVLAIASVFGSILGGQLHPLIIAYGVRINYLHLPLIWVMGAVLDRRDVERLGAALLLAAIPMTLVMVQQFRSPMDAFINRGIGDDEVGQIFGADGRIRPPGLFAFVSGPQLFLPLCAAFFFDEISGARRLPWYVLIACGIALAIALPVSISRAAMLASLIVAAAYVITLPFSSRRIGGLLRSLVLLGLIAFGLSRLPAFREATDVFMMRWDTAAEHSGTDAWSGIAERTAHGFTNPVEFVRLAKPFGQGIGSGSNVGARLSSGTTGFQLAEEEWGKVILELGPLLGLAFIFFRLALTLYLGWLAIRALREHRNALPALLFAATALTVLQGQWAPPTVLGFAVVGAGLLLAATRSHESTIAPAPIAAPATPQSHALPTRTSRRLPQVLRPVHS